MAKAKAAAPKLTTNTTEQTWPTLYKATVGEGVQEWDISVRQVGKAGVLTIVYGLQGGKKQTKSETIKEGKNAGKKNETTPFQQAVAEAQSRWTKQIERKCYGLTPEESSGKRALAPMLAQVYEKNLKKITWESAFAQPKLDGFRCLARREGNQISLTSREGKPITTMEHVVETLKFVMKDGDTFDGELYRHGVKFEAIASAIKRKQETSESIVYNVYDCVQPGAFADRIDYVFSKLKKLGSGNSVVAVETNEVAGEAQLMELQQRYIESGLEGAMLRYGASEYEAGKRSYSLLKVKTFKDAEYKVVGVREGRDQTAVFQCVTEAGHKFDVFAPGTLVEKRQYLRDGEKYIGKTLTVKYQDLTDTEAPVPRFPVAKAFREE